MRIIAVFTGILSLLSFFLGAYVGFKVAAVTSPSFEASPLPEQKPEIDLAVIEVKEGIASWYGIPFHGKRTASGSKFDMNEMTVATRDIPLGELVLIENLRNGRQAIATVTDRGPYVDGRIVDVSWAVAEVLGMTQDGVVPVRIKVLRLLPSQKEEN